MKVKELLPLMKLHGRTIYDDEKEALFTNWTCSGFSIGVKGKNFKVKVLSLSDIVPGVPGQPTPPADWPCIAVSVDGKEELLNRTECHEEQWITFWESDKIEEHEIRFIKVSENARGKLGVLEVETDGEFFEANKEPKTRIEIIGDSITCGFGNESSNNAFEFHTSEENGWMSYAAQAARALGYEFSMVCESGISAIQPEHPLFPMHTMSDIYEDTDQLYDVKMGRTPAKWDFEKNHNDIVVVNLGTNDSNPIRFYQKFEDIEPTELWFHKQYKEFIKQLRNANGPDTFICCTLGSMDYYLYHHIKEAVEEYKAETGDTKICYFEYVAINVMMEGFGALGHPSMKTHDRMGRELVNYIHKFVKEN